MARRVYLVCELMDTDLNYVIQSGQEITDDHVQYFTAQLLSGVAYLHRCSVVHRDLKARRRRAFRPARPALSTLPTPLRL